MLVKSQLPADATYDGIFEKRRESVRRKRCGAAIPDGTDAPDAFLHTRTQYTAGQSDRKRLVDIKVASEYLSIPKGSLYKLVWQKRLPFVVKVGRALRFDRVKMDRWIEDQTQEVKNF